MSSGPPIENLLAGFWWGGYSYPGGAGFPTEASNLVFGANPPYQISDFLGVYPKFGTQPQGITSLTTANGGTGYLVNDIITVVQPDATGGTLTVGSVDGNGAVLTFSIATQGSGYSVAVNLATMGGTGSGLIVNVTAITPANLQVPQLVLQMYINLASASLRFNRWLDYWPMGMSLFVAHFCTLYLRSEGNVGTTAGAIAVSGLEKGVTVSKAAGDVSMTSKPMLDDLESFGSWTLTAYGSQLATLSREIGFGPCLVW